MSLLLREFVMGALVFVVVVCGFIFLLGVKEPKRDDLRMTQDDYRREELASLLARR